MRICFCSCATILLDNAFMCCMGYTGPVLYITLECRPTIFFFLIVYKNNAHKTNKKGNYFFDQLWLSHQMLLNTGPVSP